MKYCNAVIWVAKLKAFGEIIKKIDLEKADKKRDGAYTIALEEYTSVMNSEMELEKVFKDPDNTLRNIMMLAHLDATDAQTRKV
jgi:hypothetical protein